MLLLSEEYLMGRLEGEDHEVVQEAAEALQLLQNQMFPKQILKNLKKVEAIRVEVPREEKEDLVKILELIKEEKIVKIRIQVKIKIP